MDSERTREKKKIVLVYDDPEKLATYTRPFKHSSIASSENNTRPLFLGDYFAPLEEVYRRNDYDVAIKDIEHAWKDCDTEPFIFLISLQPNIFKLYREEQAQIEKYFRSLSPYLISAVNERNAVILIHNCKEEYAGDEPTAKSIKNLLTSIGIRETNQVLFVENSPNGQFESILNTVQWNFFESSVQMMSCNVDITQKFTIPYKPFLCLNFTPRPHRQQLMYAMRDYNLLHQFNASHIDSNLPLVYDTNDHIDTNNTKPASGHIPMLVKDVDHWNTVYEKMSYESGLFIVTETAFTDVPLLFLTEKIFKPFLLKMPFIAVAQAGTLSYLRSIGYTTFSDFWNEDYDTIYDPKERLQRIITLIRHLSTQNIENLVKSTYPILESNYNHFQKRKPEYSLLSTLSTLLNK